MAQPSKALRSSVLLIAFMLAGAAASMEEFDKGSAKPLTIPSKDSGFSTSIIAGPEGIPPPVVAATASSGSRRSLLEGETRYRVMIKSGQGSCAAIYDGNNDSKPYGWSCDSNDARQIFWWYPNLGLIQSQLGSCLAIYDGNNNSKPYGWSCNSGDQRQKWSWDGRQIRSRMGSCVSVYDGNNGSGLYGWSCDSNDQRQAWSMNTV